MLVTVICFAVALIALCVAVSLLAVRVTTLEERMRRAGRQIDQALDDLGAPRSQR